MNAKGLSRQLVAAQETLRVTQQELTETNRGLVALIVESDKCLEERTPDLRAAQEELHRTNSDLLQLTLELEDRVAQRTAELQETNARLQRELAERQRVEQALRARDEELQTLSQQLWQTAKLATMGELAASIAHELNNPLATVTLRVESLLTQATEDDPKRRAL